ncbi:MAG: alpha/beta fold hydrolase [Saprospiraceae bacterium]
MPVISDVTYRPILPLRNGHLNTFYPYLFRKKRVLPYIRERILTPDDDFFDVDWCKSSESKKVAVLLHGLEGSSHSQYIVGTAKALMDHGYHVAAINFRSCSGEMNHQIKMYHSGFTEDLLYFIDYIDGQYEEIYLCGFSLGGNVVMKYLGDQKKNISTKIKAAAGISVPCDLRACSLQLKKPENYLYEKNFTSSLMKKVMEKYRMFPDKINLKNMDKITNMWSMDDYFTAPIHGFADAEDYYAQCSSKNNLADIEIPTMIINALDDSFLADESYPYEVAHMKENIYLMTPKYGGHVGFTTFGTPYYWNEMQILRFFELTSL